MAFENKWSGASSNDLNLAGNWVSGAAPASDEAALFLAEYTGNTGPGTDMATLTAVDLDLLYVGEGYTQSIGGSGNELDISADKVWYRGTSGKLWYKDGAGTTDWIVCDSTASDPLGHDCLAVTGATNTLVEVLRGKATITGGTTTDFVVGRRNANASESWLVVNSGVTISTSGTMFAGRVTCNVNPVLATVWAGEWEQAQGGAVITTLKVYGGKVILNHGGTYTTVRHYGGTIDCTQKGGIKTITNYYKYPGAVLLGENNAGLVAITNRFDVSGG